MCGIGIIHHHDSEFHSSQFQTILTEIPPLTLIKNYSDSNSHLESESAPGLNHSPVIIMLVCKINMFLKSDKHNSCVYLLKVTFMSTNLFDTPGTKNCSLIEMYS